MTTIERMQDWLLQKGMSSEIKRANLAEDSIRLSFGDLRYLRRLNHTQLGPEAVLMLHGAASDSTSWIRFAKYLKTGLPLLIPDLPGHGKSVADISVSYSIAAQAERVAELLRALGVARVHVIASSMGCAIALRLAASEPGLVSSLVLIGAVGVQAQPSWLQEHILATGHNPMIEVRNKQDYQAMIRIGMQQPPPMPGFVLSALSRTYISRLSINEKIAGDIALDLDQSGVLQDVDCPALIIWGREDKVSHLSNGQLLSQQLAHARLDIIDNVGHVPMVEVPELVAASCSDFLSSVSGQRARMKSDGGFVGT